MLEINVLNLAIVLMIAAFEIIGYFLKKNAQKSVISIDRERSKNDMVLGVYQNVIDSFDAAKEIRLFHSDHLTACSAGIFLVTGGFLLFLRLFRSDFCFDFDDHFGIPGLSRAPVSSLRMCAANNGKDEPAVHALKNLLYLLVYRVRLAKHIIVDRFLKKSQILRINLANCALVFSSTSWYNIITG